MASDYVLHPVRTAADLQIDYAGELNEQQYAAVTSEPCPALVIAGAGSGKTRTLIYRVAWLLEQGIPPERLLLLTFTNKAAREMMRRVAGLLGSELRELWGGTFHAIGARLLRRHAGLIGYRPDFTLMDREDSRDLLKTCIAEVVLPEVRFPGPDVVSDILSMASSTQRTVAQTLGQFHPEFKSLHAEVQTVLAAYAARKRSNQVMDFDDLLCLWLALLRDHEAVRDRYQRQFQFILVDEYQDTNAVQGELIDLMAARHHNVMVVGDDSQSIYSWRGADFRNILEFPKRYADAKTFMIETNYRSSPEILSVANASIAQNIRQFPKTLLPVRPQGVKPHVVECPDASIEARFVGQRLLELVEEGVGLSKMAVLYRSHFHSMDLQMELTRRNIPFSLTSGVRFFEQAHVKDVIAYLKSIVNPSDELAFKRVVMLLEGIGGKGAQKLWQAFRIEASRVAAGPGSGPESSPASPGPRIALALESIREQVPKKSAVEWAQLTATMAQLEGGPDMPSDRIQLIIEAVYEDYAKETFPNYRHRLEDLEQLAVFAGQFATTEEMLTQLSLLSNLDTELGSRANKDSDRVALTTVHQAKGLEFDVIFVIMLCDGLFPAQWALNVVDGGGEEEERRLFYVAVTRARNELYLTYPRLRSSPNYGPDIPQKASRFLKEIPRHLLQTLNLTGRGADRGF